jgi:hypothetical protein
MSGGTGRRRMKVVTVLGWQQTKNGGIISSVAMTSNILHIQNLDRLLPLDAIFGLLEPNTTRLAFVGPTHETGCNLLRNAARDAALGLNVEAQV